MRSILPCRTDLRPSSSPGAPIRLWEAAARLGSAFRDTVDVQARQAVHSSPLSQVAVSFVGVFPVVSLVLFSSFFSRVGFVTLVVLLVLFRPTFLLPPGISHTSFLRFPFCEGGTCRVRAPKMVQPTGWSTSRSLPLPLPLPTVLSSSGGVGE